MQSGQPKLRFQQHSSQKKECAKNQADKLTPIARLFPYEEQENSNTLQATYNPTFKNKDDVQTNKLPWSIQKRKPQLSTAQTLQLSKKLKSENLNKFDISVPAANPKVDEILAKPSLRQRFGHLLLQHQQLPISYQQQQIIEKMKIINRSLRFLQDSRLVKRMFFHDLKQNISSSVQIVINIENIQQILFLKQDAYKIDWELGKRNKYQITVALSPNYDPSQQKETADQLRKVIVQYLLQKEQQFINQQNTKNSNKAHKLVKQNNDKWVKGFDFHSIKIPLKTLPPNPENKGAQIRTLTDSQINKVQNKDISQLFTKTKEKSEVKSFTSSEAMNMIFSKQPVSKLKQQLSNKIKERQKQIEEQQRKRQQKKEKFNAQTLLNVCRQLMFSYTSKNVSNMFVVTLQKVLNDRLKITPQLIRDALKKLLSIQQVKLLSQTKTSDGKRVISVNKKNYKDMIKYLEQEQKKQRFQIQKN